MFCRGVWSVLCFLKSLIEYRSVTSQKINLIIIIIITFIYRGADTYYYEVFSQVALYKHCYKLGVNFEEGGNRSARRKPSNLRNYGIWHHFQIERP